jgi:hypothetical protein
MVNDRTRATRVATTLRGDGAFMLEDVVRAFGGLFHEDAHLWMRGFKIDRQSIPTQSFCRGGPDRGHHQFG